MNTKASIVSTSVLNMSAIVSSDRSSYSDNVLLYNIQYTVYIQQQRPLFEISKIYANIHDVL